VARTVATLLGLLVSSITFISGAPFFQTSTLPAQITDQEFWRLITEFSEPSGDYPYQNFVSNELPLQRIIPPTKRAIKANGVYIGVGPEQNFTYVSALQSKMAFVVDIRRQNMLLHLMYKALFEMSPTRADFMANLFSRKRTAGQAILKFPASGLFDTYDRTSSDAVFQTETVAIIKSTLAKHGFNLPAEDLQKIEYIHRVIYLGGPSIRYEFMSEAPPGGPYPSYQVLMTATDATGQNWSYLATEENFQYVREMQRKNMIVPLVGDFAGPKALRSIGQYLRERNTNIAAFYASNVESYLNPEQLKAFYGTLAALPSDSSTILMRFVNGPYNSPMSWWSQGGGHQSVVSRMSDLVTNVKAGARLEYPAILAPLKDPATIDVP
jgi:hypothetical protein